MPSPKQSHEGHQRQTPALPDAMPGYLNSLSAAQTGGAIAIIKNGGEARKYALYRHLSTSNVYVKFIEQKRAQRGG